MTAAPARDAMIHAQTRRRLDAIDGLRAIAAGSVLAYHLGQATDSARLGMVQPFIYGLKSGVTIFFVISGFLLYLPYARAIRSGGPLPSWRRFAERRAGRILPAYWIALTVVALLPLGSDVLAGGWWRYYSLTQTYSRGSVTGGLGVTWTLCVEVAFYALLPVLAWCIAKVVRRRRTRDAARTQLALVGALALGSLMFRFGLTRSLLAPIAGHGYLLAASLPGLLDWFAIGLGLAVLATEWEANPARFPAIRAMVARPGGCWLLGATFFAIAVLSAPAADVFLPDYGLLTHCAIGIAAALLVLPAIDPTPAVSRSAPIRLLTHPRMAWLGTISYGIYLWHIQLLNAICGPFARIPAHPPSLTAALALIAVTVAGAIALGAASWYLIERPAQRWLSRLRRNARPAVLSETDESCGARADQKLSGPEVGRSPDPRGDRRVGAVGGDRLASGRV
jgi:peptidoglycan/LPS O-acetylase OafA/YrhL